MSQIKLESEYKGYQIIYDDGYKKFIIFQHEEKIGERDSLENVAKYIDAKVKQKFKRIPIIAHFGWGSSETWKRGEATSIIDDISCWITNKEGQRRKVTMSEVVLDTPENLQRFDIIKENNAGIEKINAANKKLMSEMSWLTSNLMEITEEKKQ